MLMSQIRDVSSELLTRSPTRSASQVLLALSPSRMGLRCLSVRVSDREVRRLISNGYLSLERSEAAAAVAIALEAWMADKLVLS